MEPDIYYVNTLYIIASLAIVIITVGMVFVFKEGIPLLRNLRIISEKIQKESSLIIDDVESVRIGVNQTIKILLKLFNFKKK